MVAESREELIALCQKALARVESKLEKSYVFQFSDAHPTIPLHLTLKGVQVLENRNVNNVETKYPGFVLDYKLDESNHINFITKKVKDRLAQIKSLTNNNWGLHQSDLTHIYTTWVMPILVRKDHQTAQIHLTLPFSLPWLRKAHTFL